MVSGALLWMAGPALPPVAGAAYSANPSSYGSRLSRLRPGDTLNLAAGTYPGITIKGLRGAPAAWIVITGPASGPPAVLVGAACCNTVEISNSSFVSIENFTIDSKGIEGTFGISAKDGLTNLTHDIRIQNNRFVGQGGSQQTVAISTKTPTWGWIIRNNRITGAGTGIYLGNSDGSAPFWAGVIEDNLIENTMGYNMQIKWQRTRPTVPGMPTEQSSTIIRNNVFIKNDKLSPDGDRPNVLVGGFPETGPGSTDTYQVYGNFFLFNSREALLQASGRVVVHDNIFVGGDDSAVVLQAQELPLKLAHVYNNTIYTQKQGIVFGPRAAVEDAVLGNLIFAAVPIAGPVKHASGNLTAALADASTYVKAPSFDIGVMDFYPLPGKCHGVPLDLGPFAGESDYGIDFNGVKKVSANAGILFRGAYAGAGTNPGWKLQVAPKNTAGPAVTQSPLRISRSTARRGENGSFLILLQAPKGIDIAAIQWELSTGADITIESGDIVIGSAAAGADKTLTCSAMRKRGEKLTTQVCVVAGGQKKIADGTVASVRYRVGRLARPGTAAVRIDKALVVAADLKAMDVGHADGLVTIQ